jgi:Domain of unknown function (DUF4917)
LVKIISFEEAIQHSTQYKKRNLLLGNGFSIACKPNVFRYSALYNQADFSEATEIKAVFDSLGTEDFESVIKALEGAAKLLPNYLDNSLVTEKLKNHADLIKDLLLKTIAHNHPLTPNDITETQYWACQKFLSHFLNSDNEGRVYTLNYDLLLYWALMHEKNPFSVDSPNFVGKDGFGEDQDTEDADYVVWKGEDAANGQNIHYLHGALHLFDSGSELKKYTWNRKGIPLIEQAQSAIAKDMYPLFVSEGTSQQKLARIRHHAYLQHSYKSFHSVMAQAGQTLFIYGHSLAENDGHILKKIGRGKIPVMYVSLHGKVDSPLNMKIITTAQTIKSMRQQRNPLEVLFYDAAGATVWGKS